jgi:transposase
MLPPSSAQRYYFYRQPTDMRKSFNGLSGIVRSELDADPVSGDVFIFVNRRRDKIKLLVWDRTGFVIFYKSLEQGTFELPDFSPGATSYVLKWEELILILEGVALKSVRRRKRYRLSDRQTKSALGQ